MSFRDVEELLAARCIVVTYETVRQWCRNLVSTSPISVKPVFQNLQVEKGRRGLSIFDPERNDT